MRTVARRRRDPISGEEHRDGRAHMRARCAFADRLGILTRRPKQVKRADDRAEEKQRPRFGTGALDPSFLAGGSELLREPA